MLWGRGSSVSVWGTTLVPNPSPPNSQSPLEMKTSFRGAKPGILGLMRSSTVTAAIALILVDAVLQMEEKQALGHSAGCLSTGHGHRPRATVGHIQQMFPLGPGAVLTDGQGQNLASSRG